MEYFNITENISTIDRILRMFAGTLLLLAALTDAVPGVHPSVFPIIAAYLVLTAIMKWDPAGYVIEVMLRVFTLPHAPTSVSPSKPILRIPL